MLSQHLITRPVFEALFEGYAFAGHNPVSQTMQTDARRARRRDPPAGEPRRSSGSTRACASGPAGSTPTRAASASSPSSTRSSSSNAFPKMADRLGIVYTPIEVVDFIVRSVSAVLRSAFGSSLGAQGVQVLDPFTGTGTFIVRLLQTGLIDADELPRTFATSCTQTRSCSLAYYIAAINIEAAFHGTTGATYQPFPGIVLTDTFQLAEAATESTSSCSPRTTSAPARQKAQDIRVIIGNPPYSVGQTSQNDANQNLKYPTVDARIEETYAARSSAVLQRNLYDSYVRAIRWATDRDRR